MQEDPEEDEEYDTVEVVGHTMVNKSLMEPITDEAYDAIDLSDNQTYDVPKPKSQRNSSVSHIGIKTRSSSSLSVSNTENEGPSQLNAENLISSQIVKTPTTLSTQEESIDSMTSLRAQRGPVPPLPSPRKISLEPKSLPTLTPRKTQPPLPKSKPPSVRKLFVEDKETEDATENIQETPKISRDFSSKTLRPKKSAKDSVTSESKFRPRNKSESIKSPEKVQNELALILEKRRQNLTKPVIPERPKNLTIDTKDNFPPYSKVNKGTKQQKPDSSQRTPTSMNTSFDSPTESKAGVDIGTKPTGKSFLHSLVQSGKFNPANNASDYPKGW